jgi:3-mercaptopyruvate sulfurtransferase SseA
MYRKNPLPWILIGAGVLLIAAGFAWVRFTPLEAPETTATPASESLVQRVSLEDAKAAFDSGSAVFLDVRDSSLYAANHIPGAVNIPLDELPTRMSELNPQDWIIPYCT